MATGRFKSLLSSEEPDKRWRPGELAPETRPSISPLVKGWWWWNVPPPPKAVIFRLLTMADGNASILEGALSVHGHVVQSSAMSLPLRLRVVCVPFPPVSNICEW